MTGKNPSPTRAVVAIRRPEVVGWRVELECGHIIQMNDPRKLMDLCGSWSMACFVCRKEADARDALADGHAGEP